jgi:NPCBM/NEW2 domain
MPKLVIAGVLALGLASLPLTAADAGSTWRVSVKASTHQVVAGKKLVLTGHVRPGAAAAGTKLLIQEKFKPGVRWKAAKAGGKVSAKGTYRVTIKPTTAFTHQYRVVMPANAHHDKGVSPTVEVTVYAWAPLTQQIRVNDDGMSDGSVNINGQTYEHSVWQNWSAGSVEYNVNHACTKVRGTFGLSDDSTVGGQGEVSIAADPNVIYSDVFDVGQSAQKAIDLDPAPLKLKLEAHSTSTTAGTVGYGAFGDIQVLCTK